MSFELNPLVEAGVAMVHRSLLDRRAFLLGAGAAGAALLLPGCPSTQQPGVDGGSPLTGPFDRLRSFRDLCRSSPDQLSARAAEVIASKDPSRAVAFVRENIAVLPPRTINDAATDAVRWGPAATLRAGAGTLRERAELLASMLVAMGATAKLVSAPRPAELTATALYAARATGFAPAASRLTALKATPQGPSLARLGQPSPDADPTGVVNSLLALIPTAQAVVAQPFDGLDTKVPVVEYTFKGVTRWAYAAGGLSEVTTAPASLGGELGAVTYPKVSLRLLGLFGDLPGAPTTQKLVELVAGSWTVDQVAGNRATLSFPPPDPAASAGASPEQMPVRIPVISLQGAPQTGSAAGSDFGLWQPGAPAKPTPAFVGDAITLSGARFAAPASASGPTTGPYGDLLQLSPAAHTAALASVTKLEAVAGAGAFPDVQLTVSALDASGTPVAGLVAADFAVADETLAQQVVMLSNVGIQQSKVLVAFDCSSSVNWASGDRAAFIDVLANSLVTSAQATGCGVGVVPLGDTPASFGAPDATAIKTQLANCVSSSDIWLTLGNVALASGASAVVVVSDFITTDAADQIPALQKRAGASGLPVVVVPAPTLMPVEAQKTIDDIVRVCGATRLDPLAADFGAKLADFLSNVAKREKASAYRLRYRLPAGQQTNQGTRTANVSLASTAAPTIAAPYKVPALGDRGAVGIGGLYLELTVGTTTVTRRLSGPEQNRFGGFNAPPDASQFAQTRDLLSGLITVGFEPGSPTTGANLDDLVSSMLSLEPLSKAVGKPRQDSIDAAASLHVYSGALAALVEPLRPGTGPVVTPMDLRVVVMTEAAGYPGFQRRLDVVPDLNLAVAASTDAAAAFKATMAATVGLSLREAISPSSAAGRLAGATLQYVAPSAPVTSLVGFSPSDVTAWTPVLDQYAFWHRLVPTTPEPGALWIVDPATGTTVAVFLDGSGGGGPDCTRAEWNKDVQDALVLLSIYAELKSLLCMFPGMGPYACIGATVAAVGAGVAALFAAYELDSVSYADVACFVLTAISSGYPNAVGAFIEVVTSVFALWEAQDSVKQHCP